MKSNMSAQWPDKRFRWRDAWQINCGYRISHAHFTRTPTPGVCVSLSHDLQWGSVPAYGLSDHRGWRGGAVDCNSCLPSIGHDYWEKYWADTYTTQYWQVLANTQYPNTGIVRTLIDIGLNVNDPTCKYSPS